MTAFSNTADFLRLLREDPDFRDEARRLLLTQELIDLPERLARFEANMERRFDGFERRFDELEGGTERQFTEVRSDITEMKGDIAKNTSDIGGLRGAEYERRVGRSFASYASMAYRQRSGRALRRNRLLSGGISEVSSAFLDLIADALDAGLIAENEWRDLQQADAVMSGQHEGNTVYFVGEFSITVNNSDIDRAIARAATLGRATGSDAWPMVIGDNIPEPQRARAQAEGVAVRQVAEQWGLSDG
jgi:hypothetical protein